MFSKLQNMKETTCSWNGVRLFGGYGNQNIQRLRSSYMNVSMFNAILLRQMTFNWSTPPDFPGASRRFAGKQPPERHRQPCDRMSGSTSSRVATRLPAGRAHAYR